jgi:hypothetical protein
MLELKGLNPGLAGMIASACHRQIWSDSRAATYVRN